MDVTDANDDLIVTVYDKDRSGKDEVVGFCTVPFKSIPPNVSARYVE